MNLYIFKDSNLTDGIYCAGNKFSNKSISEIPSSEQTLFVLPNELLEHVFFDHDLKNKKNIHAKIINDLSSLKLQSIDLEVLDTKNGNQDYFVIEEGTKKLLKTSFSRFNQKINITSDLLFFKEAFDGEVEFEGNIYLNQISEPVKLTKKAFDLLDHDHANIKKITNKDLINLNLDKFNFYELNTFDFQSLFQFSKIKSSLIATVAFLIIVYGAGLININSNYAQIKDMNKTLTSIYGSIYPNEPITNIEKQIENKLIALNNADKTTLKRSIEIISMASQSADIIEANYSNKLLTIKCLFTNDAEESIFINQQNRLNYSISIKNTESNQLGQITTIEYDL